MLEVVSALDTVADDSEVLLQQYWQSCSELGRQCENDEGVEEWESLHHLVDRAPEADAAESAQEQVCSCY